MHAHERNQVNELASLSQGSSELLDSVHKENGHTNMINQISIGSAPLDYDSDQNQPNVTIPVRDWNDS